MDVVGPQRQRCCSLPVADIEVGQHRDRAAEHEVLGAESEIRTVGCRLYGL